LLLALFAQKCYDPKNIFTRFITTLYYVAVTGFLFSRLDLRYFSVKLTFIEGFFRKSAIFYDVGICYWHFFHPKCQEPKKFSDVIGFFSAPKITTPKTYLQDSRSV